MVGIHVFSSMLVLSLSWHSAVVLNGQLTLYPERRLTAAEALFCR